MKSIDPVGRLLETSGISERRDLIRELMKSKQLAGSWSDPRMKTFVQEVANQIERSTSPSERLANTVLLSRMYSAVPKARSIIAKAYSSITNSEPAPLSEESDSEDRLAAATLITHLDEPWVASYVARQIVVEESAEKAREQLIRALLAKIELSTAFRAIRQELEALDFKTASPAESLAKRLRRIVVSMRKVLPTAEARCGTSAGDNLRELVSKPLAAFGTLPGPDIVDGLAEDILGLIYDIVRTQIELAAEPTVYEVARVPRGWVGAPLWPRFIAASKSGRKLLSAIEGAIILLGRQGLASQTLRDLVVEMVGSHEGAMSRLRKLGDENPDLPPDIRVWLQSGGKSATDFHDTGGDQHFVAGTDEYIGAIMLAAAMLRRYLDSRRGSATDNRDQGCEATVESRLITGAQTVVDEVLKVARHRRMELVGAVGEIVTYSRHAHELTVGNPATVSKVRIVRPLVERVLPTGKRVIVTRAVVESAEATKSEV